MMFVFILFGLKGILVRGGDVILENVTPGISYDLYSRGYSFGVKNGGEAPVSVIIEPAIPKKSECSSGYEPIPDPGWISLEPSEINDLCPQCFKPVRVVLHVPDREEYKGKHYQVFLYVREKPPLLPGGGVGLATGFKASLRFSVGTPGPHTLEMEKLKKKLLTFSFDLFPNILFLMDLRPQVFYPKKQRDIFRFVNKMDTKLVFEVSAEKLEEAELQGDFVALEDTSIVKFKKKEVKINPYEIKDIDFYLDLRKLKGRYGFNIVLKLKSPDYPVVLKRRVFFEVKDMGG